jgi:hypothetical protein
LEGLDFEEKMIVVSRYIFHNPVKAGKVIQNEKNNILLTPEQQAAAIQGISFIIK